MQLQDISPSSFVAGKHLAGRVNSLKPYNDDTKLVMLILKALSPSPATSQAANALPTVEIELKGKWAQEAQGTFLVGLVIIVSSEYANVVERTQQRGVKRGDPEYRLQFENGIKGFIVEREEDRTPYHFINPDPIRESFAYDSRNCNRN